MGASQSIIAQGPPIVAVEHEMKTLHDHLLAQMERDANGWTKAQARMATFAFSQAAAAHGQGGGVRRGEGGGEDRGGSDGGISGGGGRGREGGEDERLGGRRAGGVTSEFDGAVQCGV